MLVNTNYNVSSPTIPAASIGSSVRRKRHADDEIGNTISNDAAKLRNMTTTQQGIAEKLINEVIFLGRFERLTFNTSIQSPGLVQESQRPLIHIPDAETQAFNLSQGSQAIDISDTLVEYLKTQELLLSTTSQYSVTMLHVCHRREPSNFANLKIAYLKFVRVSPTLVSR
nr:unnamed protein product [Callosobruchus analis]